MADAPLWRRSFDGFERALGGRLEQMVQTEGFAVAVGLGAQAQKGLRRRAERLTRRTWHLANLPAGSDITRLMGQIGRLERQVQELQRALERAEGDRR